MSLTSSVLIVSAFGRGHALAIELAQAEIPVTLLDVSTMLGDIPAEDAEGPFGFFSQGLQHIENQRLLEDHPPLLQVNGFTWMLEKGPVEMKGPLTAFHREQLKIPDAVWNWITVEGPKENRELNYLLNGDFDETWLYHLSRSFHANFWLPNYRAGVVEGSLPFAGDFFIRSMSRAGILKSFEAVARAGAQVRAGANILDAARDAQKLKSLEVKFQGSDTAELVEGEQVVWFLSGEETEKLSFRLQEKIFTGGIVRPRGSWLRARLKLPSLPQREALPLHSVWVRDIALPWTHDNLWVLIRTSNPELFDIWFRIPEIYRFQKDYVLRMLEGLRVRLEERLQLTGIQAVELPVSVVKDAQAVGPTPHPLFDEEEVALMPKPAWKNFHWVGIEACLGLGWNYMFMQTREVAAHLKEWWKLREEERRRLESRVANRETST